MPTKFNTTNEGRRVDLDPVVPVDAPRIDVEDYTDDGLSSVLDAVSETMGAQKEAAAEASLGQYATEASSVIEETEGYARERERLLQGLAAADPKDRAAIEAYYTQLSRLRRGEIQGALSPAAAQARLNTLTKTYINRYPQLALKFRQLHAGLANDVPNVAGATGRETDPDMAAIEELTKEATMRGWSIQEVIAMKDAQAKNEATALRVQAMEQAGKLRQGDIEALITSEAEIAYKNLVPAVSNMLRDPNSSGKQILGMLLQQKAEAVRAINKALTEGRIKYKMIYDKGFEEAVSARILAPINQLIEAADKTDNLQLRAMMSDHIRKIGENGDIAKIRKEYGPFVSLVRGTEDLMKYVQHYSKTAERVSKGTDAELRALAQYDPYTRMTLEAVDSNMTQIVADAAAEVDAGNELKQTGNDYIDKVRLQSALDYGVMPGITSTKQEDVLALAARNRHAFEAWDSRKDVVNASKNSAKVEDALRTNSSKILTSTARDASVRDVNRIQYNALNKKEPFSLPYEPAAVPSGAQAPGSGAIQYLTQATNTDVQRLVTQLNQHFRVFSNFMSTPELQKWGAFTLDEVKASRVPGYEPEAEETPAAPVVPDVSIDPLTAEAQQAGMTVDQYKAWINTPAQ